MNVHYKSKRKIWGQKFPNKYGSTDAAGASKRHTSACSHVRANHGLNKQTTTCPKRPPLVWQKSGLTGQVVEWVTNEWRDGLSRQVFSIHERWDAADNSPVWLPAVWRCRADDDEYGCYCGSLKSENMPHVTYTNQIMACKFFCQSNLPLQCQEFLHFAHEKLSAFHKRGRQWLIDWLTEQNINVCQALWTSDKTVMLIISCS